MSTSRRGFALFRPADWHRMEWGAALTPVTFMATRHRGRPSPRGRALEKSAAMTRDLNDRIYALLRDLKKPAGDFTWSVAVDVFARVVCAAP